MKKIIGIVIAITIIILGYIGLNEVLPGKKSSDIEIPERMARIRPQESHSTTGKTTGGDTLPAPRPIPAGMVFSGTQKEIFAKIIALVPECEALPSTQPTIIDIESAATKCTTQDNQRGGYIDGLGGYTPLHIFSHGRLARFESDELNAENNFIYDAKKNYVCKSTRSKDTTELYAEVTQQDLEAMDKEGSHSIKMGKAIDVDPLKANGLLSTFSYTYDNSDILCLNEDSKCAMMNTLAYTRGNNYVIIGTRNNLTQPYFLINGKLYNPGIDKMKLPATDGLSETAWNFAGFTSCDGDTCKAFTVKKLMKYTPIAGGVEIQSHNPHLANKYPSTYTMKTCEVSLQ